MTSYSISPDLCALVATGLRGVDPARAVLPQGVLHTGTSLAGGCSDVGNKQVIARLALESLVVCRLRRQFWSDAAQSDQWTGRGPELVFVVSPS
jgi:hypothetical protein